MKSDKQKIIDWLFRKDHAVGLIKFDQLLEQAACEALQIDNIAAADYVAVAAKRTWNAVIAISREYEKRGVHPLVRVKDNHARLGVWRENVASKAGGYRTKALRTRCRAALLRELDSFTDREYEAAGCIVASLIGADKTHLTPATNEGGVDFFARIRQPGYSHILSGVGAPLRIIGQSKKYSGKVTVDKIKEFIQTIQGINHQTPKTEAHVPVWFRDSDGPILGWMNGHSGFQSGAKTTARNHGIILSDSIDLSEAASQSRGLMLSADPSIRARDFGKQVRSFLVEGEEG